MDTNVSSEARTNALLAWLFSPITSFLWKSDKDAFLQKHARNSLYYGIANLILVAIVFVLQILYGIIVGALLWNVLWGLGALLSCVWSVIWITVSLFSLVPRIVGMIKANNGEVWEVPYVQKWLEKVIKL
jgi:uncharacterized Tic20 family protein